MEAEGYVMENCMLLSLVSFIQQTPDLIFWAAAFFGTILFCLRLCATIIGGFGQEWADNDDGMFEDGDEYHHTNSLKIFTLHSISGFFMMFGWVGLACIKSLQCNYLNSLIFSLIAGFTTMILTAFIFKWSQLLESTGSRFIIEETIGLMGTVYQRIPAHGQGKILLVVNGVTRELLARSDDSHSIESFCTIQVTGVLDQETVLVKKIILQKE